MLCAPSFPSVSSILSILYMFSFLPFARAFDDNLHLRTNGQRRRSFESDFNNTSNVLSFQSNTSSSQVGSLTTAHFITLIVLAVVLVGSVVWICYRVRRPRAYAVQDVETQQHSNRWNPHLLVASGPPPIPPRPLPHSAPQSNSSPALTPPTIPLPPTRSLSLLKRDQDEAIPRYEDIHVEPDVLVKTSNGQLQLLPGVPAPAVGDEGRTKKRSYRPFWRTREIGEAAAKTASNFGTVPMAVTIVSVVLLVLAIVAAMYKYNKKHPWKGGDETEAKDRDVAGSDADSRSNHTESTPPPASPTSAQLAADRESSPLETVINPEMSKKQEKQDQKPRWFIGFEK
ncbi:hypothetical protein R3P38DRAFT_3269353 [Favolaschia claudopus]|uniref:Transmembrane protein n=1 Tax=Favolaschia claudopus TaxID=2862362 RepID=A0AAW0BMD2_9AGAR